MNIVKRGSRMRSALEGGKTNGDLAAEQRLWQCGHGIRCQDDAQTSPGRQQQGKWPRELSGPIPDMQVE